MRIHLACKALRASFIYLQHTIHADCKNNASCSLLKVFSSSLGMALLTVFRNHNSDKTKQFPVWLAKKNIAHAFLLLVHFIKDLRYKSEFLNGSAIRTRNLSKQFLPLQSEILTTKKFCAFSFGCSQVNHFVTSCSVKDYSGQHSQKPVCGSRA